ncbi:MAG: hypothetical protein ACI8TA_003585 [Cyclobacteriaceae bacterium]|jgi:hypothetical protein
MRIHQLPLDEGPLWEHLQAGEFEKAEEIVDYYYSRTNPDGFDDPSGITKATNLAPTDNYPNPSEQTIHIKKSTGSSIAFMIIIGLILSFFSVLSYLAGTIYPLLFAAGLLLMPTIPMVYNLFDKSSQITLSHEHLEFKKSKKAPINWNNILCIYHYHRGNPGGVGGQSADFIEVYRKNAVKSESFYLNNLEHNPTDIVLLIYNYWKKKEI